MHLRRCIVLFLCLSAELRPVEGLELSTSTKTGDYPASKFICDLFPANEHFIHKFFADDCSDCRLSGAGVTSTVSKFHHCPHSDGDFTAGRCVESCGECKHGFRCLGSDLTTSGTSSSSRSSTVFPQSRGESSADQLTDAGAALGGLEILTSFLQTTTHPMDGNYYCVDSCHEGCHASLGQSTTFSDLKKNDVYDKAHDRPMVGCRPRNECVKATECGSKCDQADSPFAVYSAENFVRDPSMMTCYTEKEAEDHREKNCAFLYGLLNRALLFGFSYVGIGNSVAFWALSYIKQEWSASFKLLITGRLATMTFLAKKLVASAVVFLRSRFANMASAACVGNAILHPDHQVKKWIVGNKLNPLGVYQDGGVILIIVLMFVSVIVLLYFHGDMVRKQGEESRLDMLTIIQDAVQGKDKEKAVCYANRTERCRYNFRNWEWDYLFDKLKESDIIGPKSASSGEIIDMATTTYIENFGSLKVWLVFGVYVLNNFMTVIAIAMLSLSTAEKLHLYGRMRMVFACVLMVHILVYGLVIKVFVHDLAVLGYEREADMSYFKSECPGDFNDPKFRLTKKGGACDKWARCMKCKREYDCYPKQALRRVTTCWALSRIVTKVLTGGHELWGRVFDQVQESFAPEHEGEVKTSDLLCAIDMLSPEMYNLLKLSIKGVFWVRREHFMKIVGKMSTSGDLQHAPDADKMRILQEQDAVSKCDKERKLWEEEWLLGEEGALPAASYDEGNTKGEVPERRERKQHVESP